MSNPMCPGKTAWPELLGKPAKIAAAIIEAEKHHKVKAIIVKVHDLVTQDYWCNRVWVWKDEAGLVARIPIIG